MFSIAMLFIPIVVTVFHIFFRPCFCLDSDTQEHVMDKYQAYLIALVAIFLISMNGGLLWEYSTKLEYVLNSSTSTFAQRIIFQ